MQLLQDLVARRRGQSRLEWWLGLSWPLLPPAVMAKSSPSQVQCDLVWWTSQTLYSLIPETLRPWNFAPLQHGFLEAAHRSQN